VSSQADADGEEARFELGYAKQGKPVEGRARVADYSPAEGGGASPIRPAPERRVRPRRAAAGRTTHRRSLDLEFVVELISAFFIFIFLIKLPHGRLSFFIIWVRATRGLGSFATYFFTST
jgi:hypothetical protein